MSQYKAILFDLDDTLIDRNKAVDVMFSIIAKTCYFCEAGEEKLQRLKMMLSFKQYDNRGYSDKTKVLNMLFDEYPPFYRIPSDEIKKFWDTHFPNCFTIDSTRVSIIVNIIKHYKTAIVTNGSTQVQKAKIEATGLDKLFEVVIISDEVGVSKPDSRIFELAMHKLGVQPKDSLFIGDNLERDINGCQKANIKGIWFNPNNLENNTDIVPSAVVNDFNQILSYIGL